MSANCVRAKRPAALEHAEVVGGRHRLPRRQRRELRQPSFLEGFGRVVARQSGDLGGLAVARVRLAEDVALERQDAVVVRGPSPEHRGRRHEASLDGIDDELMTRAARLARDAQVAGVYEADELGRLAVEQRVRALGRSRRRPVPRFGIARAGRARGRAHHGTVRTPPPFRRLRDVRIPAVTIRAPEHHGRRRMHRRPIGRRMTARHPTLFASACSRLCDSGDGG
jgi:hypothetical protein